MALKFNEPSDSSTQTASAISAVDLQKEQEIIEFDVAGERASLTQSLTNSQEVDDIVSAVDIYNPNTLVLFGNDVAEEISKCSDQVLDNVNMSQINDSGALLQSLARIMDQFDINELDDNKNQGLMGKLFNNVQKQLDKLLSKYQTMGNEIDKVFIQLKSYENEIMESNEKLDLLFNANIAYYHDLVKYILAGEQAVRELDEHIISMRATAEQTQDSMLLMDVNNLEQAKTLLEQRVLDLKMAESVALQSLPMLRTMQYSNLNLIRKINSAFIVTLPIFKQGISQAVLLKRQRIQAEALKALDDRTNEMLLKNAQNTVDQAKLTAQLASGSSIKIETLEKTWATIVNGIEETKQLEEAAKQKRKTDSQRLDALKNDYQSKMLLDMANANKPITQ